MTLQAPKLWRSRQATVSNLITPKNKGFFIETLRAGDKFPQLQSRPQKRNQAEEAKDNPGMKLEDFFPSPPNQTRHGPNSNEP